MTKEFKELLFRHYFFNNCNTLLKEFDLSKQECMFKRNKRKNGNV